MEKPEPDVKKPFPIISWEDMKTKYMNDVFWYVLDEKEQHIIGSPSDNDMEPIAYTFQEKEDAEKWEFLVGKTPAYQDLKRSVKGQVFQSILDATTQTLGEFMVVGISHAGAKILFENYEYYLLFYGWVPEGYDFDEFRIDDENK